MALMRASRTGLLVLCIVSLLLVSSFAAETAGAPAHDAGGRKMKRVLMGADDDVPPQPQTYPAVPQPPTYYVPPQQRP
ncbi:unnamed protein product [Urochloa humidicola]